MVGDLIRMRWALARNSAGVSGAFWTWSGAVIGAALAAGAVVLAALPLGPASLVADLLAVAYLTWMVGWLVGPVWSAPPLRPVHLAMLPLPRHRLAGGLLVAGFAAPTFAVTVLLFASLVVYASHQGLWVGVLALPVAALQAVLLVLMSRVAHVQLGRLARGRSGAALNGVLLAVVLVITQSGWMLLVGLLASGVLEQGFPESVTQALRWVPSSWGLAAVESAARGQWPAAGLIVMGMMVLGGAMLALWSATLGGTRGNREVVRGSARRKRRRVLSSGAAGAILGKELRSWWRDPARFTALTTPVVWGLLTAVLPLTFGVVDLLPWAGTMMVVMAVSLAANLYSFDGTGIWLTLQSGSERADIRARQGAFVLVYGPVALLATIALTAASSVEWAWPWVLAALFAAVGGGAGLVAYASVALPAPRPDPRERTENPADGGEGVGQAFALFFAALLPPVPGLAVVLAGARLENPVLQWAGVGLGAATGGLLAWSLGRAAVRRLERTGPEILQLMRAGRAVPATASAEAEPDLTGQAAAVVVIGWTVGPLAAIPQGLVPLLLKITGNDDVRVWFLAMYLPGLWGWLAAVGLMLGGGCLVWLAASVRRRAGKHGPGKAPSPGERRVPV
ncbi:hypothetical protein [Arthrobacter gengyunqii]|uniref:ABC-2 type transport system permease protein n=1 Tax=Arthrobacter gengyunqii TaxID=2886940 RepID=A0ABS8GDV1_9MICC|nr:hypothetical protein [Arthrobacter gengyunqii]MCC3264794.1 hypothetical protein [Arthrobacter gengyunqii]